MECKHFERMIPSFFEDKLDDDELKNFINHIMTCKSCREEVTIQYLITEGLQRLENGSTFDVQKELDEKLNMALHRIAVHRRLHVMNYIIEILSILMIIGVVFALLYNLWVSW